MYRLKYSFFVLLPIVLMGAMMGCSSSLVAQNNKGAKKAQESLALELTRASQIFTEVLSGTTLLYVDTVDVNAIATQGINVMLSQLDPYTIFIPEVEREDFSFMTTGAYGGIGAYIQQVDSMVYVRYPMPHSPAKRAGLQTGDRFIKIDTVSVLPGTAQKVSESLKGPVGTTVSVTVERLGESKPITITIRRDHVVVDQVSYQSILAENIGYVRLDSFTDKSAANVLDAYEQLAQKAPLKGLILDLRSNPGGVLDGAIDILSMFLPHNTLVLKTKGRLKETTQEYRTKQQPWNREIPLVVLINEGSASASEIVAGALQDMDRSVLIGKKSFGKGLVQTTRPLSYDGILKVTTSRYFIPSGRCIQQLDYSHRKPDGSVAAVPDSLTKVFYTTNGRPVKDGGGIRPDIEVEDELLPAPIFEMIRGGKIFEFTRELVRRKEVPNNLSDIQISDKELEEFLEYLEKHHFKYGKMSAFALDRLKELAKFEGYAKGASQEIEALRKKLTPDLRRDVADKREEIRSLLRGALAVYHFGIQGQISISLENDPTLKEALRVLKNPEEYKKLLKKK